MKGTHFLVTGGAGFIGSHLVDRLLADGHRVSVLDDFSTGRRENLSPFLGRFSLIEGSVTDMAACKRAVEGVDYVLHQAALGSVPRSVADPLGTHSVNATGTLNLLIAARDAGVKRFVFAGSSSAYGDTPELPKHEGMLPRPRSPYAVAKLAAENYCAAFFRTYGMPTITLRYFNVFGPRQDPASQYAAVLPKFITAALDGKAPTIYGDGGQTRDFTYVENVVEANLRACTAPDDALGKVFNVGAGARTSLLDVWNVIQDLVGVKIQPHFEPTRTGDVRDSLAALDLLQLHLGYRPHVTLRDGLRITVESYQREAGRIRDSVLQ